MKKFLQISIIFLIILISVFFYQYYLKTSPVSEMNLQEQDDQSILNEKNNLIKNLKYNVKFDDNSEYTITAEVSELSYQDGIEIVFMKKVSAIFVDKNISQFTIIADEAIFNNSTYNTNFIKNIEVNYMNNKIFSEKLDLNFTENNVSIYENVVYEGLESIIKADNVKFDLITKNAKIFMNNTKDKVEIISKKN